MTAKEIRTLRDETVGCQVDGTLAEDDAKVFFLSEIAAQLAEHNRLMIDLIASQVEQTEWIKRRG